MDGISLHADLKRIGQFQDVSEARNDCGTLKRLRISPNLLNLAYSKDDFHACKESLASRTKHKTYRIHRLQDSKSISCEKMKSGDRKECWNTVNERSSRDFGHFSLMAVESVGSVVYWSCRSNGESDNSDFVISIRTGGIDIQTSTKTNFSYTFKIKIT
jgi:hypothetical protein